MEYRQSKEEKKPHTYQSLWAENIIQINQHYILQISEKISQDKECKFPLVCLRIFNHLLASVDKDGKVTINARQLSKAFDVHYDTITKSIKYLKSIDVIKADK